jgi:hypothetical protein
VNYEDPKTGDLKTEHPGNAGECQSMIDTANVKYLPKGLVRVWQSIKLFHGDKKGHTWRKDLYEIDCVNKKWRYLQIGFDALTDSVTPEEPSSWYWTEPDSIENNLTESVCKH